MQAFGLGCLDFFTSVLDFIPEQIRGHLDLFVLGELGIYMYRDEEARLVSFHADNNLESLPVFRRLVSCRAGFCWTPTSST